MKYLIFAIILVNCSPESVKQAHLMKSDFCTESHMIISDIKMNTFKLQKYKEQNNKHLIESETSMIKYQLGKLHKYKSSCKEAKQTLKEYKTFK